MALQQITTAGGSPRPETPGNSTGIQRATAPPPLPPPDAIAKVNVRSFSAPIGSLRRILSSNSLRPGNKNEGSVTRLRRSASQVLFGKAKPSASELPPPVPSIPPLVKLQALGFPADLTLGEAQQTLPLKLDDPQSTSRLNKNSAVDLARIYGFLIAQRIHFVNPSFSVGQDGHIFLVNAEGIGSGPNRENDLKIIHWMRQVPLVNGSETEFRPIVGEFQAIEKEIQGLWLLKSLGFPVLDAYRIERQEDNEIRTYTIPLHPMIEDRRAPETHEYGIRTDRIPGALSFYANGQRYLGAASLGDIETMDRLFKETRIHARDLEFLVKPDGRVVISRMSGFEQHAEPSFETLEQVDTLREFAQRQIRSHSPIDES